MEHPAQRYADRMNSITNQYNAKEQDNALKILFTYYNKSYESDIQTRAQWATKLKDLGYGYKEICDSIDVVVLRFSALPSLAEFIQMLPPKELKKTDFYDSLSREAKYEQDTLDKLKRQFIDVICTKDEVDPGKKYRDVMTKLIKAWFIKVYEYTEEEFNQLRMHTKLHMYERCVLLDWRDSNFGSLDKIIETGKRKRYGKR
jgi:hypothetical protein